jgi:hypothetical protein
MSNRNESIPLDFSGHVLSGSDIDSVVNISKIVSEAYERKVVANELKIFSKLQFLRNVTWSLHKINSDETNIVWG